MSKLNQVIQIGMIEGDCRIYLEDYAYTYLKKQLPDEKKKYFLYGEKAGEEHLYIYGIADAPKMEHTYFKEYSLLGVLKIKEENQYWICLKGKEILIEGFFVFYAPNQAMQEYLIDHSGGNKEEENTAKGKIKNISRESIPVKKRSVSTRRESAYEKRNRSIPQKGPAFPVGLLLIVFLVAAVLTTENGKKKLQIMGDIVKENFSIISEESLEDKLIIEERKPQEEDVPSKEDTIEAMVIEENGQEPQVVPTWKEEDTKKNENTDSNEITQNQENQEPASEETTEQTQMEPEMESAKQVEDNYEEYIVREGDTLAGICNKKYGSLSNMKKICNINGIENADYIAPGQKIYLPK